MNPEAPVVVHATPEGERIALVQDGVVVNVILADPDTYQPPEGMIAVVVESVGIGDLYDGGTFTRPPSEASPYVPPIISDRQFFQQLAVLGLISEDEALLACEGKIPASLDALVETLPQEQRFPARMFLKGATEFKREHPMTAMFGAAVGWSDDQLDALWQAAALL